MFGYWAYVIHFLLFINKFIKVFKMDIKKLDLSFLTKLSN